ncbi:DUF1564 family protein [Leptospira borgpetersenii]|nr:DUF1564 family protein [Leptospira borgpetersenii]MDQ7243803.1 DUF1564 family protein [Leptospira borgpetersenii]
MNTCYSIPIVKSVRFLKKVVSKRPLFLIPKDIRLHFSKKNSELLAKKSSIFENIWEVFSTSKHLDKKAGRILYQPSPGK